MDELKEQHNSHAPNGNGYAQDTPPRADVDEILRRKRKAREYKVRYLHASCLRQWARRCREGRPTVARRVRGRRLLCFAELGHLTRRILVW